MTKNTKISLFAFLCILFFSSPLFAQTTWYVRADGGTRYSVHQTSGQCDGKADAAYSGVGINQHCAFGDLRYLWDDQSYGNSGWVIAGGDTVILDNTKQWRVGFDQNGPNDPWCFGGTGPFSCYNPTIPAGTASQHTRILGRNYAACSTGGQPDPTKMSQIFGGHGVNNAFNLTGAQYVDVECIEVTRHSSCMVHGLPVYGSYCSSGYPLDDYDSEGVGIDSNANNVLMQDMYIHGHVDSGIRGNIGPNVTLNRVKVAFNGMSGWNLDDGTTTSNGTVKLSYVSVIGNGCIEEYPDVHAFPALVCYDQQSSGYGDGIGTQANYGVSVAIDHSVFAYNTQDGLDLGHVDTYNNSLSITDSSAYGNMGGQFKWGGNFQNAVFENNLSLGNCARMGAPLPGAPSNYNQYLSEFCRAFDGLSFNFRQGGQLLMANNTIVSYAPTTLDVECWDSSCSNSVWNFENNVVLGYDDPATYSLGGTAGGPGLFYLPETIGTINRVDNIYHGIRGSCQANVQESSNGGSLTGETCADPAFLNEPASFSSEATLDSFNFGLSNSSAAVHAGIAINGLTADFNSVVYHNPPSLGGLELGSTATFNVTGVTTSTSGVTTSSPGTTTPVSTGSPSAPAPAPATPNEPAPTTPTSPATPSTPSTPTTPSTPATPTTPTPSTPAAPTPSAPTTPAAPSTPAAPKTPSAPSKPAPVATTTVLSSSSSKTTALLTVAVNASKGTPSGIVVLYVNGVQVGTATLSSKGTASTVLPITKQSFTVQVRYLGSSSFAASASSIITVK